MIMESLSEKIEKIAEPFLKAMNVELVELNIGRYKTDLSIRILADKQNGGITIKECSQLNRHMMEALETGLVIDGPYTLEVSSPGLDRPLKSPKDFQRVIGRQARFFLSEPVNGRLEYAGPIRGVHNEGVIIDVRGQSVEIPILKINKARQIIEV